MKAEGILLLVFWGPLIFTPLASPRDSNPNVGVDDGTHATARFFSDLVSTPEGDLFSIWSDNSPSDGYENVYVSKSIDGGQSWSTPFRLNDKRHPPATCSSTTSEDKGRLYVVWLTGPASTMIFYSFSVNKGNCWQMPSLRVDDGSLSSKSSPDIAVDRERNLFVLWSDDRLNSNFDIFCSSSSDSGLSWSDPDRRVNDDQRISFRAHPAVCAWGHGQVGVVWAVNLYDCSFHDIFFSRSLDEGTTWPYDPSQVNDDGQGRCQHREPSLGFGPEGGANISFFDYREGEPHIYSASGKTTGLVSHDSNNYALLKKTSLIANFPNPFNTTTSIIYRLPHPGSSSKLSLKVYDLTGRLMRTLLDGHNFNCGDSGEGHIL